MNPHRYRDRTQLGMIEQFTQNYGIFSGGVGGGQYSPAINEKLSYSSAVMSFTLAQHIPQCQGSTGTSQANVKGYISGGNTGAKIVSTFLFNYAAESVAAKTTGDLSAARLNMGNVNNGTNAYIAGGYSTAYSLIADKLVFATDTTSANTASNLTVARDGCRGVSDGTTYGYFMGGNTSGTVSIVTTDRLAFSNGATSANTASDLSQGRSESATLSGSSTNGYILGGGTAGGATAVVTADRIVFSTSITSAYTTSNLSTAKTYITAVSNSNVIAYISGGWTGANTLTTMSFTYATEAVAAAASVNLTGARRQYAGISSNCK